MKCHLFRISASNPTFATLKSSAHAREEATHDLMRGSEAKAKINNNSPSPQFVVDALYLNALNMHDFDDEDNGPPPPSNPLFRDNGLS